MKINIDTGELFVYGFIGDAFMDGLRAIDVIEGLDKLGGKRATVRINSGGGIADEGVAIYEALKRYNGGVDVVVDALAASAAAIVGAAGETRTTAVGGRWMIHRSMTIAFGNSSEMRKTSHVLDKYDSSVADIFAEILELKRDAVLALMDAETWYTADEALAAKLSTKTGGPAKEKPQASASWYRHPPLDMFPQPVARTPELRLSAANAAAIRARSQR